MYYVIDTLDGVVIKRFTCPKVALKALGKNVLIRKTNGHARYVVKYIA